eukprot:15476927-Alexandrium_andersonii.AAC.1
MPSKRERTANGLRSLCDWLWLSGASSRCPVAASVPSGIGDGAQRAVGTAELLPRAALSTDSALLA